MESQKIPGDRLVLGMLSAFRTLVWALSKNGARRYAAERQDENPQYTKHPATWLNGGCWMDEPGANSAHYEKGYAELADDLWREIECERNGNGHG